jgi:asparagine synthase (glutamine-hydrolysing)
MCGIAGVITKTDNFSIQYYPRIFKETLSHRGPDEDGEYIQQNWSFANLRLSIVDVQGGQQPIRNDDGSIGIIYNGEVYNFEELKKSLIQSGYTFNTNSDTEVILRAYEAYGSESFNKLNGMFAFCLWDHNKDEVYLVRDHFGIKPLYVYEDEHQIVFSSELRGILVLPNLDLT